MSTALAIAGVTAVMRGLIDTWLGDQDASAALGGANADVSAVAPDTIELTGPNAGPRLNLFLHHVTPNSGWQNVGLPSVDGVGTRVSSPPLALDLHYLLTAYGPAELQAEVLLGLGMQRLHQFPVLARAEIEARLPVRLRGSQLGRQVEMIRITPEPISTDELSKVWTALQAHYRPSTAYHVSVVLIETPAESRASRPVLSRGPRDPGTGRERGVVATPGLVPTVPELTELKPPAQQLGAQLGQTVELIGRNLAGTGHAVLLDSALHGVDRDAPAAPAAGGSVTFTVPNTPAQLPVGLYGVRLRLVAPGEVDPRETNELPLSILPRIVNAPTPVARNGQGTATVTVSVRPQVRPYQRASLILGAREVPAESRTATTGDLQFKVADAAPGAYVIAVRIDGIESPRVDRSASPPAFVGPTVVIT